MFRRRMDMAAVQQFHRQEELFARCVQEIATCSPHGSRGVDSNDENGSHMPPRATGGRLSLNEGATVTREHCILSASRDSGMYADLYAIGDSPVEAKPEAYSSQRSVVSMTSERAARSPQKHSTLVEGTPATYTELIGKSKTWKSERSIVTRTMSSKCSGCMDWWDRLNEPERKGRLAKIVQGKLFESLSATVIIINAFFACYATNQEVETLEAEPSPFVFGMEIFFLSFYTLELVLKLIVHGLYFFCNSEMQWNIFDALLVIFSIFDQVITAVVAAAGAGKDGGVDLTFMRTLRILKMAKILRGLRVMKVFSELRLMLNSLAGSLSSLFWSICMLILIFYIFGLVFVQGVSNYLIDPDLQGNQDPVMVDLLLSEFGRVERAILTLYKASTGGDDWNVFFQIVKQTGFLYSGLFIFFIAFSQIALLNILTAIFVQNAMKLARPDKEAQAYEKLTNDLSEFEELRHIMKMMDANQSGTLSADEFEHEIKAGKLGEKLAVLGLNVKDAASFFNLIASGQENHEKEITIESFINSCMAMRGHATCIDLQSLAQQVTGNQKAQLEFQQECMEILCGLDATIRLTELDAKQATPRISSKGNCTSTTSNGIHSASGPRGMSKQVVIPQSPVAITKHLMALDGETSVRARDANFASI